MLNKAPRCWSKWIKDFLNAFGLKSSEVIACVNKTNDNKNFVDNSLIAADNEGIKRNFQKA